MVWFISYRRFLIIVHTFCTFALGKLRTYTLQFFIFLDISQPLRCFTMLSPNMTIDFPLFIPCLIFYLFSCSAFFFLFRWCLWSFPVFAVKLLFSVAAFILSVSLIIIDLSNKSLSWVVFCCTSLWLESREQWILSDISWLFRLLHSTTTLSRLANCCPKEWLLRLYFLIVLLEM